MDICSSILELVDDQATYFDYDFDYIQIGNGK